MTKPTLTPNPTPGQSGSREASTSHPKFKSVLCANCDTEHDSGIRCPYCNTASTSQWHVGEEQPDLDPEGNGYCWPVCLLTREERERSKPGEDYAQNPAYCNSREHAERIVAAVNACAGIDTDLLASLKPGAIAELLSQRVELLAACKAVLRISDCNIGHEKMSDHFPKKFAKARAAIARAEKGGE